MKRRFVLFGLLLLAALLAGCQHQGDDWYCVTLPNIVMPEDNPYLLDDAGMIRLGSFLPTGHLPLHDKDLREIHDAMRKVWRDRSGMDLDFSAWKIRIKHWAPGKVFIFGTWRQDSTKNVSLYVCHTAAGWKVLDEPKPCPCSG